MLERQTLTHFLHWGIILDCVKDGASTGDILGAQRKDTCFIYGGQSRLFLKTCSLS